MQINTAFIFELFQKIFFVLFGGYFIIYRKKISKSAVYWNTKLWHFAAKENQYQITFFIAGVLFLIFGLLVLFGAIHFR